MDFAPLFKVPLLEKEQHGQHSAEPLGLERVKVTDYPEIPLSEMIFSFLKSHFLTCHFRF